MRFNITTRSRKGRISSPIEAEYNVIRWPRIHPRMETYSGSARASILLIAPPCSQEEYDISAPFTGEYARIFQDMFRETGLEFTSHFFVVSASLAGLKANKASTEPIRQFVKTCAEKDLFKAYVCMGTEAFRFVFSDGKKISSTTLIASTVFLPDCKHKPTFIFPEISPLVPAFTGDKREDYKLERQREELLRKIPGHINAYVRMLEQHVKL